MSGEPAARRQVAIIGAASNIGIRPYDDRQQARHLDRAPAALRELGLAERLGADDLGDLMAPPVRDFTRRPGRVRNEDDIVAYSRALAERVAHAMDGGRFVLVLGGDCSIVLGTLLGAAGRAGRIGLAYIDGHADFATPDESQTGSAASMCLALAVGRGDSPLARLAGPTPLVRPEDVALIGRRDEGQAYGHSALAASGILDIPGDVIARSDGGSIAAEALERIGRADLAGFWVHVDADVLDASVMPAVDFLPKVEDRTSRGWRRSSRRWCVIHALSACS